jgi:hypothetical protein
MAALLSRTLAGALLLTGAAGCKKKIEPAVAPPVGIEGANCYSAPCNSGLECTPMSRRCAKPDDPEIVAATNAARDRERAFLAQSGVAAPTHAEAPATAPPPPATPLAGAIRIVTIANEGKGAWVFAACRADERLVSGGCKLDENRIMTLPSFPTSDTTADTVGARWNCGWRDESAGNLRLEAFALCQRL